MFSTHNMITGQPFPNTIERANRAVQQPQPSVAVSEPVLLPTAMEITDRSVSPYRQPVMPEEINCHWATNLQESVLARMIDTVPLQDVLPQLYALGYLNGPQQVAVAHSGASCREINAKILDTVLQDGKAETFAGFLNLLRNSSDPVQRQWFTALTGSELFVIDRSRQLNQLIAAQYETLCWGVPAAEITDLLWQEGVIALPEKQQLERCSSHRDAVHLLLVLLKEAGPSCWTHFVETLCSEKAAQLRVYYPRIEEVLVSLAECQKQLQPTCTHLILAEEQLPACALPGDPEPCAVTLNEEDIRSDYLKHFTQQYWPEAAKRLQLTATFLDALEEHKVINSDTRDQIDNTLHEGDRNMLVLNVIRERGGERGLAEFLNLLNHSRDESASHAALFDEMATDPGLMVTPLSGKRPTTVRPPEVATTGVTISEQDIHSGFRERIRQHYSVEGGKRLKLYLTSLAQLAKANIIDHGCRHEAEDKTCRHDRNRWVLNYISEVSDKPGLAGFLNFLAQTSEEVVSHAILFDEMVQDPAIMATPIPPRRAIGTPAFEVEPSAIITDQHIHDGWHKRFTQQYWLQNGKRLQLSSDLLGTLEAHHLIDPAVRLQAERATSHEQRTLLVLNEIRDYGGKVALAGFLNVLNQNRKTTAAYGALFDEMVADAEMMVKPLPAKRPTTLHLSEVAPTALKIHQQNIRPTWREHFIQRYWPEAARQLKLSLTLLATLEKNYVIPTYLRQQAEDMACGEDANMLVLNYLLVAGGERSLTAFLNGLDQSREDIASHGNLFDEMATDPGLMVTPLPITQRTAARPPEVAPLGVTIRETDINSGFEERFRQYYQQEGTKHLRLSPYRLAQMQKAHIINPSLREHAESLISRHQRNLFVLSSMEHRIAERGMAKFLNFLNQTRGDVPSHGALFDEMKNDPQIVKRQV